MIEVPPEVFRALSVIWRFIRDRDIDRRLSTLEGSGLHQSDIQSIKVMTQAEYDALPDKDARTLYLVSG